MRIVLGISVVLALAITANADLLVNGDMEYQESGPYGSIYAWGPNGAWAPHANHPNAGYDAGIHGNNFGYYSAGGTETVGQVSSAVFAEDTEYQFYSWATGGGSDEGKIVYEIGYDPGTGFVPLAQAEIVVGDPWILTDGVTYMTGTSGPEIGLPIVVRLGDGIDGEPGASDIWFDNLTLTPEPTSLVLLALGVLLRRR